MEHFECNGNLKYIIDAFKKGIDEVTNVCSICQLYYGEKGAELGKYLRENCGKCPLCEKRGKCSLCDDEEIILPVYLEQFKNLYTISNKGHCFGAKAGKKLATRTAKKGGPEFLTLYSDKGKKQKTVLIHKLVYLTFKHDYDDKKYIQHIDGNNSNNNLKNLRCVSKSEIMIDAHKNNDNLSKPRAIQVSHKNGVLIGDFDNLSIAMDDVDYKNKDKIYQCLRGEIPTAGNFIWRYKDDVNNYISNPDKDEYIIIGEIDGYDFFNYSINIDGTVINNSHHNRIVKPYIEPDNYTLIQLQCPSKREKTFGLHRLLGKYFLEDGEKYFADDDYVINHINQQKDDNNILNLEWVPERQNVIHSCGKKVNKIDINTNQIIKTYDSLDDASKDIKKSQSLEISSRSILKLISQVCHDDDEKKKEHCV